MDKKLNLNDLAPISSFSEAFSHSGEDYIFSHIIHDKENPSPVDGKPLNVTFDGLTVVMVVKGDIKITLNGEQHVLSAGSIAIMSSHDVMSPESDPGECEFYTLFLSADLLTGINFDVNVINPRFIIDHKPVFILDPKDVDLVCRYLYLLHSTALSNNDAPQQLSLITRSIGRNIVLAMMYQLVLINERYMLKAGIDGSGKEDTLAISRKTNYVHEFMRLLQEHYRNERTVSFYAGKLCISPKYLSLLVRDVTGRSAAAIIDQYVVNEAKNMLRYSGFTIQQVAYKLNFPNQSAFGKYFKHLTGVSPTEFRSR